MKYLFLWGLPGIAVLIESTVLSLPLTLCTFLVLYSIYRTSLLFCIACITGICLDIFLVRPIGVSSMFFVTYIFIIFLYERKFEVETSAFVFFSSFLGSIVYVWAFGYNLFVFQAFVSALVTTVVFALVKKRTKRSYE